MTDDLHRITARAAVARLRSGELTPFDLIAAAERRAAAVDRAINALVTPTFDRARRHAERLLTLPAGERGLLCGLPIATAVAGVRTTYGSPLFADFIPLGSDEIVETLEAHGALVVGMTNTPEFGAGMGQPG